MFISLEQLRASIAVLNRVHPFFGIGFLGFKVAGIPVGDKSGVVFSTIMEDILQTYYRPSSTFPGFYSPFKTSSPEQRWLSTRYGSTSLQRIASDRFGDALLHEKGESAWGWKRNYIEVLMKHLGKQKLPLFHLGAWLLREEDFAEDTQRNDIVDEVVHRFEINSDELTLLCDASVPQTPTDWLTPLQPTPDELYSIIGHPPGDKPLGASLISLHLKGVGPGKDIHYTPSERLNIITGDNSLGKTFLLDTIWWALTGSWYQYPALPPLRLSKSNPRIEFTTGVAGHQDTVIARFSLTAQQWVVSKERALLPGMVLYARHDGSFAVWDVYRALSTTGGSRDIGDSGSVKLSPAELWNGKLDSNGAADLWTCNGLIRDWVSWQSSSRFKVQFDALLGCLAELSPNADEPLLPGEPTRRLPLGAREVPTLKMPYGDVPLPLASAGIQRAVAIAYVMVWSWFEHLVYAEAMHREPQRQLVVLVDEVEAHLHPRWQRVIVPALMNVVTRISPDVTAQLHVATHSPMVMASIETRFEDEYDAVFHLEMRPHKDRSDVTLTQETFVRRGTIDRWLIDPLFGLEQARSREGEGAVEDATKAQQVPNMQPTDVADIHRRLKATLADDDPFWPRWLYFAQEKGVEI